MKASAVLARPDNCIRNPAKKAGGGRDRPPPPPSCFPASPRLPSCLAQDHVVISDNQLVLDNGLVRRQVQFSKQQGAVCSTQLIDYAFVEHAEGNWLSNVEPAFPTGGLRARDIAWARSPSLPSGTFLVGNLNLDDSHYEYNIKCQLGSMPLFLCDLRKVDRAHLPVIARWAQ